MSGDNKTWQYFMKHYSGKDGKVKLMNKLKLYDLDVSKSYSANVSKLRQFRISHPKTVMSPDELNNRMFVFDEMEIDEKRNLIHSLQNLLHTVDWNTQTVRIGLYKQDVLTEEKQEQPVYKTLGRDINIDYLVNTIKRSMYGDDFVVEVDREQIDEETPFTDFNEFWWRIYAIDIKIHNYVTGNRTRGGAKGSFRYNLIDDSYDLSKFQIYNENQTVDSMPCFVYALKQSGKVSAPTIASIYKDIENIYFVETKTVDIIAKKYNLRIHINFIDFKDNKKVINSTVCNAKLNPLKTIYLNCMFNHFFVDDKLRVNVNYYQFKDDKRLKPEKKLLVWKNNGEYLKYYKDENAIKEDFAHNIIPNLYLANAFKPIETYVEKKLFKERKIRPYSFDFIENINYRKFELKNTSKNAYHDILEILSNIPDLYQVSGNVYNIIKNCEYAGQYLFKDPMYTFEPLYCLDINSMYAYVLKQIGISTGVPEIVYSAEEALKYNSFMIINITKINKHRKFDVLNDLSEGMRFVRTWDLKDLIQYNEIEYEFIAGISFKGKRDFSLNKYIDEIYEKKRTAVDENERKKYKSILNKYIYGMTLYNGDASYKQKELTDAELDKLYDNKPFKIISARKVGENKNEVVLSKKVTNSYNLAQIGVEVSSYARHILHEYIYTCEDNGIEVYHGYTDSFYIKQSDFEKFKQLFPNSIGDGLGQLKIEKDIQEAVFKNKITYALKLTDGTYAFSGFYSKNEKSKEEIFNKMKDGLLCRNSIE